MTERARMGGQYGVDPSDRQGAGDSSGSSATNIFASSSATPTAARDESQPTSLSSPLALCALTPRALYLLAHTSDTTSTSPA
jgi:hypothetical protein